MSEYKKCTVKDGKFVIPCESLERIIEDANPNGSKKGVFMWQLFIGGEHLKDGMLFNNCQFCAVDISEPFKEKE